MDDLIGKYLVKESADTPASVLKDIASFFGTKPINKDTVKIPAKPAQLMSFYKSIQAQGYKQNVDDGTVYFRKGNITVSVSFDSAKTKAIIVVFGKSMNESVSASSIFDEVKKLEPFKGIKTDSDEKQFITKVKKFFKKHKIEGWKVDFAIEDFRKKNSGRTRVFLDARGLLTHMAKNKDLDQ